MSIDVMDISFVFFNSILIQFRHGFGPRVLLGLGFVTGLGSNYSCDTRGCFSVELAKIQPSFLIKNRLKLFVNSMIHVVASMAVAHQSVFALEHFGDLRRVLE